MKLDYHVDTASTWDRYRIETYFFIPQSLGINRFTYSKQQFYTDIQAYIRFKTPTMTFRSLLDRENSRSPLIRLERDLVSPTPRPKAIGKRVRNEMAMLGCVIRSSLRIHTNDVVTILDSAKASRDQPELIGRDICGVIGSMVTELEQVLQRMRGLRVLVADNLWTAWEEESFEHLDEFLSLEIEARLTEIIQGIDQFAHAPLLASCRADVVHAVLKERQHREDARYRTAGSEGNHHLVYRRGLLKKFITRVLFLEVTKEKRGTGIAEFGAGFAAAVAMLFAAFAAIWAQETYGVNTLPFVGVLVVSYVLKDRIKDWLKRYLSSFFTRYVSDYQTAIEDPSAGVAIGRCDETFSFISSKRVPSYVLSMRHQDAQSVTEKDTKQENVIRYVKEVRIFGRRIGKEHGRLQHINDIIRFNISEFLTRMDDPHRAMQIYDETSDRVVPAEYPRLYHVNVVFVLRAMRRATHDVIRRMRVVLNKEGIQWMEEE